MGLLNRDREVIHVQLFDYATGKRFAESHMPAAQLPASFESSTTLHLGLENWRVIEARPMTAAEYRRTGKLVLILDRVITGTIDPKTILFSLPTITSDALPPVAPGTSKLGTDAIEIHEDDWRQIEWLPSSAADTIDSELASVRKIYEHDRKGPGFANCHARTSVPTLRPIPLSDLREALGSNATWLAGFSYEGVAGIAANSFAVRLISSIELFGVAPNGMIEAICFANTKVNNVPEPDVRNLAEFAAAHDLLLVDWCRVVALNPIVPDYSSYFTRE